MVATSSAATVATSGQSTSPSRSAIDASTRRGITTSSIRAVRIASPTSTDGAPSRVHVSIMPSRSDSRRGDAMGCGTDPGLRLPLHPAGSPGAGTGGRSSAG